MQTDTVGSSRYKHLIVRNPLDKERPSSSYKDKRGQERKIRWLKERNYFLLSQSFKIPSWLVVKESHFRAINRNGAGRKCIILSFYIFKFQPGSISHTFLAMFIEKK